MHSKEAVRGHENQDSRKNEPCKDRENSDENQGPYVNLQ
ncbi:hypothetical protein SCOR_27065 [Sulfidibacter corallicola]